MFIRKMFGFLLIATLISFLSQTAEAKLSGSLTRQEAIDKYFKGQQLDPIEGIWSWNSQIGTYEVAIMKNRFEEYKEYDYIGITTLPTSILPSGSTKLLIGKLESNRYYPGQVVKFFYAKIGAKTIRRLNTRYFMPERGKLEFSVPAYNAYDIGETVTAIKIYPEEGAGFPSTGERSYGTGFFVGEDVLATNCHVIRDAREIMVKIGESVYPANVIVKDSTNDLALLRVVYQSSGNSIAVRKPKPLTTGAVRLTKIGSQVFTIGYPMPTDLGVNAKISEGIINSLSGMEDDPRMFQISIPIQPGNSGGPLINEKGEVIGIVTSTANSLYFVKYHGTIPQNVNFAVKINYLANLAMSIDGMPEVGKSDDGNTVQAGTLNAEQTMMRFKDAVVLIESRF